MDSRIMTALGDRVLTLGPQPAADSPYKHFKLTRDADGVAWLLFDRADASANTLSSDVMEEFDAVLAAIETERPAGLVIRSAKPSGFIAGADVNEFRGASDPEMVETRIRAAHAVVDHLEALRLPTVAVIHGFCLGGGLEVALACQSRIAIEGARFGFPEVMLGLHPGLGGTARFTALVNPTQSMALMLTGRTIDARRAKSLGLVDTVTQERHVRGAVKDVLFGRLKRARPGLLTRAANLGPVRGLLAKRMRSEAAKAAPREHYPAPYALIDLWETHGGSKAAMLAAEQASFAKLMVTPTAQNLIRVFFLREQMKKAAGAGNAVKHVHVIGAGAMGGDIAAWCAGQGLRVSLADMKAEPIAGAVKRAAEQFGMPMGPIELADQVGLDICLDVGDMLRTKFGDLLPPTPAWLREKVAKGELGRKTGRGFYTWKDGKAEKVPLPETGPRVTDQMIDRLVLPMSNVCVAALREGIVEDPDAVDGAMIFGTGYAPFRGGPLNYARTRGLDNVVSTLRELADRFGGRFAPDAGWDNLK
ncbi:enoyl-CoA hydratase/carnithine racemase/3-hydroxyacyl-CoA dehydrogenase [Bradyrhizobium diazoefficiens]